MKQAKSKAPHRVRNWSEYNQALVNRGSLTIWFDQEAIDAWVNEEKTGKPGAPRTYTDAAIECALVLKAVYRLTLRATEGFVLSLVELLKVDLPVPDYTTICRRSHSLRVQLPVALSDEPLHVLVDSSGIKVFGEGEWKVRKHGYSKRRTWRKLHIGVDAATQQIVAAVVTTNEVGDPTVLPDLLDQIPEEVEKVTGDGAYDTKKSYEAINGRGAKGVIPPRRGAKIWKHGNSKAERHNRDENLRGVRKHGRKGWKKEVGYHERSLAETAFFRLKTVFGERMAARTFDGQATELFIRCSVLNRMTMLGMPDSFLAA